ncbi:MAG: FkbM family methyltransferase [Solirubrobacteraceae bacterium]
MPARLSLLRAAVRVARPGIGLTRLPLLRRLNDRLTNDVLPWAYRRAVTESTVETEALGFRFRLDGRDAGVTPSLLVDRRYEARETALFTATVRPGDVVIDVGANVGVYTLLAARAVGPSGRVYAVEPDPRNFELLSENIALNGLHNVVPLPLATGAVPGRATLFRDRENAGLHSLAAANLEVAADSACVEVVTLDEIVHRHGIRRVDVLKLDVQGAEGAVLAGAAGLLQNPRLSAFIEYWPNGLNRCGDDPEAVLRSLAQRFEIDVVDPPVQGASMQEIAWLVETRGGHAINLMLRPPLVGIESASTDVPGSESWV